jgi:hypothetical protein
VHKGMVGITRETLMEAHQADLDIQDDEGVNFKHTWADPESGMAWCLSEAPNAEAVKKIHQRTGHPAEEVFPVPVQVLSGGRIHSGPGWIPRALMLHCWRKQAIGSPSWQAQRGPGRT